MTPETLTSLAAILLSLLASYCPGFSPWYNRQTPENRRLVMLGLLLAAALGVFLAACTRLLDPLLPGLACDGPSALLLARLFIAALVANQAAFLISPRKTAND